MENSTLNFNYMKTKVGMNLKDWAICTALLMVVVVVFYVAVNPHW
jgi:hypothetical protein